MKTIVFLLCIFMAAATWAQDPNEKEIQKGNDLYKKKEYQKAEEAYNSVLTKDPGNTTAQLNKSNALYRGNKRGEAIKVLDDLVAGNDAKEIEARAYYNKGAILSVQNKLEESIEAYKASLRRDPSDKDARENLQKALIELKKRTPQKKEEKKDQQSKKQPEPRMNQKEAEQRLKLLEQKEKEVQQRLQKERAKQGGGQEKDW